MMSAQQTSPATGAPAGQSTTPAASGAAGTKPATGAVTTTAQGKTPPQAKTQPEFDAYRAAVAGTDPAALEKAADDFATKFPTSELKVLLYRNVMRAYQNANDSEHMLAVAQKVLALDPDDPEALVGAAEVIIERTRDTDIDKDQRFDEGIKDAQKSIQTVETDVIIPAGTPQEKIDQYKASLKSTAYSLIGTAQFGEEKYADAEANYRKALDIYPQNPDPVVVLRLALTLDKQNRYPEALKVAEHAVELTQDNTSAGTLARRERDRLAQLTGSAPPPAKPAATAPAPK
jgi:tetratricopeptide (TPR) repeat protein